MYYLKIILFIIFIFCLQTVVFPAIPLGSQPDLVIISVILWGLLRGPRQGLIFGLIFGLSQDFLSGEIYFRFLSGALLGFAAGSVKENLFSGGLLIPIACVFLGTFVGLYLDREIIHFLLGKALPLRFLSLLMVAAYNVILTPFLFIPLNKLAQETS